MLKQCGEGHNYIWNLSPLKSSLSKCSTKAMTRLPWVPDIKIFRTHGKQQQPHFLVSQPVSITLCALFSLLKQLEMSQQRIQINT